MKLKTSILALVPLLWATRAYGIYGHITQDTTWSDTVLVTGDVVVDPGVCLTIEPGSLILFIADTSAWEDSLGYSNRCDLIVKGRIISIGTSVDSITFTSSGDTIGGFPEGSDWGIIRIENSLNDSVSFTNILFSTSGIYLNSSSGVLKNSRISYCSGSDGTYIDGAESSGGIRCIKGCWTIEENIISNCKGGDGFVNTGDAWGIWCSDMEIISLLHNKISNVIAGQPFTELSYGGSRAFGNYCNNIITTIIKNNEIKNCVGGSAGEGCGGPSIGIYVLYSDSVILEKNQISGCKGGDILYGMPGPGTVSAGDGIGISCQSKFVMLNENKISGCIGGSLLDGCPGDIGGDGSGIGLNCERAEIVQNRVSNCIGGSPEGASYGISFFCEEGYLFGNKVDSCWGDEPIGGNGMRLYCISALVKGNIVSECSHVGIICGEGIPIIGGSSSSQNDIYSNKKHNIANLTPNDIIATYNWWGTTDRDTIEKYIYDHNDNPDYGYVIYEPWAEDSLGVKEDREEIRSQAVLQIYPNPFYRTAEIRFETGQRAPVNLKIYDATGRLVRALLEAGAKSPEPKAYSVVWNGEDDAGRRLPAGVYFCTLEAQALKITKKLIFLR